MSIKPEYISYLKQFERTETLYEFSKHDNPAIALRHDVDHCLDTALEMAFWEHEHGIRSTYYILHTAEYMNDPLLYDKCLQIQKFGHEVGLHTNFITQWYDNDLSPKEEIAKVLKSFRDFGVNIHGSSAHGDRSCYNNNFINYWMFKELKPDNPTDRESVLNAEGIFEKDISKRIVYPSEHYLEKADGSTFKLWKMSAKGLGLEYEASHLESELYFTDSGGSWKRTPDPKGFDLSGKRVQVLFHPIHWKAPKRSYFFLSTARSGSKWLSNVLSKASSCSSRHEYTLNHFTGENGAVKAEKMTGDKLHHLLKDKEKIHEALNHTKDLIEVSNTDFSEVNVYLPMVLEKVREAFPNSTFVHLHRDPKDVVRSIMNRGWYDTPSDTSHPSDLVTNWDKLSPFEKCCTYVANTNQKLINNELKRLSFEEMTSSNSNYLKEQLKNLGIAYYPHLAEDLESKPINQNKLSTFPAHEQWSADERKQYDSIVGGIEKVLGYDTNKLSLIQSLPIALSKFRYSISNFLAKKTPDKYILNYKELEKRIHLKNCKKSEGNSDRVHVSSLNKDGHSIILLGGADWSTRKEKSGWPLKSGGYYSVKIGAEVPNGVKVSVFCLFFDKTHNLVHKRVIGSLTNELLMSEFNFAQMGNANSFNLAVYVPKQESKRKLALTSLEIEFIEY